MRALSAIVGATEGSIIAPIITSHTPRNQPSEPSPVQGPSSMPCIWSIVHHQPSAASPKRSAISPSRVRAAANAGPRPGAGATFCAVASTASGGPGELGGREARAARVLDPEGVDPGSRRLRDRQVRPDGVEHALEADRLPVLLPEGDDVFDLEVDGVADADAVSNAVVEDLDRRALDADKLPHERRQPL